MSSYNLSYVLTTYNKLPYLRQVVERLIAARQPDEEIVVCDGGSKDGTPHYLQELYNAGKIQQFVSERDKGEAHGFNKAMLMAKGQLLKIITDDDAFCYSAIANAKQFMMQNPDIDVLTGNTGLVHLEDLSYATVYEDVEENFSRWLNHQEVVWMIGLPLIIRRKSLALTGLFNPGVVQMDTEFAYRITSLNVNIAWSTAMLAMRIENPQSNFRLMKQGKGASATEQEVERMQFFYDRKVSQYRLADYLRYQSGWVEKTKSLLRPVKRQLFQTLGWKQYQGFHRHPTNNTATPTLETAFDVCDAFMTKFNDAHSTEYRFRVSGVTKVLHS